MRKPEVMFTDEQKLVIAKFFALRLCSKECSRCSHYRGCQGAYWDWSDTCKKCDKWNMWNPSKETIRNIINRDLKDLWNEKA